MASLRFFFGDVSCGRPVSGVSRTQAVGLWANLPRPLKSGAYMPRADGQPAIRSKVIQNESSELPNGSRQQAAQNPDEEVSAHNGLQQN